MARAAASHQADNRSRLRGIVEPHPSNQCARTSSPFLPAGSAAVTGSNVRGPLRAIAPPRGRSTHPPPSSASSRVTCQRGARPSLISHAIRCA